MKKIVLLIFAGYFPIAALGGNLALVVLGSGGPRSFGRAGSSYLVELKGKPRILVDAGPGSYLRVGEMKADLDQVDTVLLTHLHIDHTGDLPALFLDRTLTAPAQQIQFKVFGPAAAGGFPATTRFLQLLFDKGGAWEYQKTFGSDEDIRGLDVPLDPALPPRQLSNVDGLRIEAVATHHGDCPSVAYRVDFGGESITFSGDLDAAGLPNLVRLAKGCSLLVVHCAVLDPPHSSSQLYALHTAPRQIGEAARDAGAQNLLLSHVAPDVEAAGSAVLKSIRTSYRNPVNFAHDKMRMLVKP